MCSWVSVARLQVVKAARHGLMSLQDISYEHYDTDSGTAIRF